jgi:hypothetical protein
MKMCKHYCGGKYSGSHTTAIDAAGLVLDAANKHSDVKKMVLGFIVNVKGRGEEKIKFCQILAGLKVTVKGRTCKQELFIYTSNPKEVEAHLQRVWDSAKNN